MLYPNGTVWVNYRVRVKGPCAMDLSNFPMDVQTCHLIYESFNYNNQEVRMRWNPMTSDPVSTTGPMLLPDFDMIRIESLHVVEPYPAGMWDELHVKLTFKRRYVWYFMQAYVPTYLTIFISWVSFSLGSKSIPARTMLGVNALLAMIFQVFQSSRGMPCWALFCPCWALFCPCWALFCPCWALFCPCWALFCPSWALFCPCWALFRHRQANPAPFSSAT
jgi:hypothetical protein